MSENVSRAVIGMTEEEAVKAIKDAGCISRVVHRDGEYFCVTMDYCTSRINLHITQGKVTAANVG